MAFQIRRISNIGAKHPVVARLGLQTAELMHWSDLDKPKNEAITELYARDLTQRLLRCDEAKNNIKSKMLDDAERVRENAKQDIRSIEIPYVIGLEGHVEDYLYETKNYLRDLLRVFQIAYACKLKDASAFGESRNGGDSDLVKWFAGRFGRGAKMVQILKSDQLWITELIRKRNAVEHPGGLSGTLTIHNIRVQAEPAGLIPPTWQRTGGEEFDVISDMEAGIENLLTLAEDALADLVLRESRFKQLSIYEIPEGHRDAKCPIRLKMGPNQDMLARMARSSPKKKSPKKGA